MTGTRTDATTGEPGRPATDGHVVVGYDGSWHSRPALACAAQEATSRGLGLTLLSVVPAGRDPEPEPVAGSPGTSAHREEWERASAAAGIAAAKVRDLVPGLPVAVELVLDVDAARLREHLSRCRLLVVGDRGRQGARAFLLGSTSRQLVRAAHCPVLVVPEQTSAKREPGTEHELGVPHPGAVMVGLGNGPEAEQALRLAADEALRRGRPLHVLRSYAGAPGQHRSHRVELAWAAVHEQLRVVRLEAGLQVTVILTADPPTEALLHHGRLADLVVVGSRGPIALARLAADSVSRALLDSASWPVLVVPR